MKHKWLKCGMGGPLDGWTNHYHDEDDGSKPLHWISPAGTRHVYSLVEVIEDDLVETYHYGYVGTCDPQQQD